MQRLIEYLESALRRVGFSARFAITHAPYQRAQEKVFYLFTGLPILTPSRGGGELRASRRPPAHQPGDGLLGSAGAACPAHGRPRPQQPGHHRRGHLQRPTDVGAGPVLVGAATAAGAFMVPAGKKS